MTYSTGNIILATDYNGFASTTADANVDDVWGTGSGNKGYGQSTTLGTVAVAGTVTATSWSALCSRITSIATHTGTSITSRVSPVTSDLIGILAALNTDLTNCNTNRGNAVSSGTEYKTWTGSSAKTSTTGSGQTPWTITFTHTVTFGSANEARYFFNAGGIIKWAVSKTSTGQPNADVEWNDLATTLSGDIYITGGAQTINGVSYTGTTKNGGTGTPTTLSTATGWYALTGTPVTIYQQNADTSPYTGQFIRIQASATSTVLTLTTTWVDPGGTAPATDVISGGTDTASPFTTFGTAPATVVTYIPPETTNLTATWGTPAIAAAIT